MDAAKCNNRWGKVGLVVFWKASEGASTALQHCSNHHQPPYLAELGIAGTYQVTGRLATGNRDIGTALVAAIGIGIGSVLSFSFSLRVSTLPSF